MFTVTVSPRLIFLDDKKNHWSTEADARESNAEIVAVKLLGKAFFDKSVRGFTTVRNLSREAFALDLRHIADILQNWLDEIEPQIAEIEGEIGYGVGPSKSENRLITLDDGTQHHTREHASSHILNKRLGFLRAQLTDQTVRALCNVSKYITAENAQKQCSPFAYETGFRSLLSFGECANVKRKQVEKVAVVLRAMYDARVRPVTAKVGA